MLSGRRVYSQTTECFSSCRLSLFTLEDLRNKIMAVISHCREPKVMSCHAGNPREYSAILYHKGSSCFSSVYFGIFQAYGVFHLA